MAYNHGPSYSLQETGPPGHDANAYPTPSHHQTQQSPLSGLSHQGDGLATTQRRSLYFKFVRLGVRLGEWWLPEITSFLIAGGFFGFQVWLILAYDLEPVSSWRDDNFAWVIGFTTLQSVISLISTLMRGAIFFPVASAIGQWKWHKYRGKPHSLDDLDRFDKASRGMTGSIGYLFSGNFWSPASLGCAIIISGIFFGPSLQNTVRTKPLEVYANFTATLPVARSFNTYNSLGRTDSQSSLLVATPYMMSSIARGWAFGMSAETAYTSVSNDVHPSCPGNRCEWRDWSSLELSAQCTPASVEQGSDEVFSAAANISSSRSLNGTVEKTALNMAALNSMPANSSFAADYKHRAILAHVGIISDFNSDGTGAEAVECILYWHAIQGTSVWLNGNVTVDRRINESDFWQADRGEKTDADFWDYPNVTIQAPWSCDPETASADPESSSEDSCNYTATSKAQRGLFNSLWPYLTGHGAFYQHDESNETFWLGSDEANDVFFWDWYGESEKGTVVEGALLRTANRHMVNIAYSVSTAIRRQSETPSNGSVYLVVEHFEARWGYLIPPGVVMALSMLFFAVAAICTRRNNVWRNSQLPLLYHGLEQTGPKEWRNMRMTTMWEAAYDARVKLETDVNDGGLKLHRYTDAGDKSGKGEYSRVSGSPEVVEQTHIVGGKPV